MSEPQDWIGFVVTMGVEEARRIAAERLGLPVEEIEVVQDGASVRARPLCASEQEAAGVQVEATPGAPVDPGARDG